MIKVYCEIDPSTKKPSGYCEAKGYVKISGDPNDVANELRVIITQLEKQVGESLFAEVLDDWLTYEKRFK